MSLDGLILKALLKNFKHIFVSEHLVAATLLDGIRDILEHIAGNSDSLKIERDSKLYYEIAKRIDSALGYLLLTFSVCAG